VLRFGLNQVKNERDHCKHDENEKQDLGNFHCARSNTAKTKQGCNQCNDKKHNSVVQHSQLLGLTNG
jgi:hypothetical protein